MHFIFAAACHYYMGMFKEAEEMAQQVCTVRGPGHKVTRWRANSKSQCCSHTA